MKIFGQENKSKYVVYKPILGSVLKEFKSRWQFSGDAVSGWVLPSRLMSCPCEEGGEGGFDGYRWRLSGICHCLRFTLKNRRLVTLSLRGYSF